MDDLISKKALLKNSYIGTSRSGNDATLVVSITDIQSIPIVKALTIDRLAEIMKKCYGVPCYYGSNYNDKYCFRNGICFENDIDGKDCWKEFFNHYAEGEE